MALYHNHCREGNSARKQFSFQHRFFGTLIIASSLILCTSMSAFMVLLIQMLLSFLSEQNVCSAISTAIQTSGTLTWLCQHSGQTCERCNGGGLPGHQPHKPPYEDVLKPCDLFDHSQNKIINQ